MSFVRTTGEALSLDQATRLTEAALAHGAEIECDPLTVAVLDPGGHLVALARQDGSGIARPEIAMSKAWIALGMGFDTRELANRAQANPHFVSALTGVTGGRAVPAPGGLLVGDQDRRLCGAIGISGDTSDRDETCALRAIAAVGLVAI
ncbi:MAG: heme-binding protein [Propionibacteriales bacterium]|nr:heme-binding protein [Propionibacteriales bacterium]